MRLIVNKSNYFILSLSKVSNPLFDKRNHHLAKPFEKYCSSIFRELKCLINQTNLSLSGRILFHQETHPAKVGRKLMTRPASNTVNLRSFFFAFQEHTEFLQLFQFCAWRRKNSLDPWGWKIFMRKQWDRFFPFKS